MLFNSLQFIIFFPIVAVAYYVLPQKLRNLWLLLASYFFYMCWNVRYALLLFASTAITYLGGLALERLKQRAPSQISLRRLVLLSALLVNLFILFYYKYLNFILELLQRALGLIYVQLNMPAFDILLPVGISFYTFQALGYLIDVYRGDIYAEKNPIRYALFVSFFPQLVAGPIERSKNLLKQLDANPKADLHQIGNGLLLMLWGFFLKLVIAERCGIIVDTVYDGYEAYGSLPLALANILFAFQIYCDFFGYSTIAKGAAQVLGIELMENFTRPYFSGSVKEFWRRWHISLSTWFKDYLYIPLGGNRRGRIRKYRNLFITFMVSGLWHGASLNFVVWGMLHGLYQILEDLFSYVFHRENAPKPPAPSGIKVLQILKTFLLVDLAWIFFRAKDLHSALSILKGSFMLPDMNWLLAGGIFRLGLGKADVVILLFGLLCLLIAGYIREKGSCALALLGRQKAPVRFLVYQAAVCLIILSMDIGGAEFIYFQF